MKNHYSNNKLPDFKKSAGLLAKDFNDPHVSKESAMWLSFWNDLIEPFSRFKRMVKRHANIVFKNPEHTMMYLVNSSREKFDFQEEYEGIKKRGAVSQELLLQSFDKLCNYVRASKHHTLWIGQEQAHILAKDLTQESVPMGFMMALKTRNESLINIFLTDKKEFLKLDEHFDEYLKNVKLLGASSAFEFLITQPHINSYLQNPGQSESLIKNCFKINSEKALITLLDKNINLSYVTHEKSGVPCLDEIDIDYQDGLNRTKFSSDHPLIFIINSYLRQKDLINQLPEKDNTTVAKKKKI